MLLLIFSSLSLSIIPTYYLGNWTLNISVNNDSLLFHQRFQLSLTPTILNFNDTSITLYQGRALLKNISLYTFDRYFYSMIGFSDPNNQTFIFFQIPTRFYKDNVSQLIKNNFTDLMQQSNSAYPNSTYLCNLTLVYLFFSEFFKDPNIIALNYSISPSLHDPQEPFLLPISINGSLYHKRRSGKSYILNLSALKFNMLKFISEGKIFGILSGVFFVFCFYAWESIFNVRSRAQLSTLSLSTYLMHASFDFSYSVYLLNLSLQFEFFRLIFLILFLGYLSVHFTLQMSLITNIWKASADLNDLHEPEIRRLFLLIFFQIIFFMMMSLFSIVIIFDYPLLPCLFLYSCFIPQIYKSAIQNSRKKKDTAFTIFIALNRLSILWYFFLYPYNIEGSYSIELALFITVYFLIQIIIVFLQNAYGGSFFIPRRYRATGFNYYSGLVQPNTECAICMLAIEPNEETMVTPCHHAFHKECLSRWMEEQMVCPICRAQLPFNNAEN